MMKSVLKLKLERVGQGNEEIRIFSLGSFPKRNYSHDSMLKEGVLMKL